VWLVTINEFDVLRTLRGPDKANPELIVHPDRMLSLTIAFQGLKPIGWGRPQIVQNCRCVEITELAPDYLDEISGKSLVDLAVESSFS
jgi:hypothetical protein